ncbi:MAG: glycosyltransferase family 2 protein [Deltaproteobacteria bacterium]|nr:glycosyltransferase family 2 protein [Deltaproteobacteria bacterium]
MTTEQDLLTMETSSQAMVSVIMPTYNGERYVRQAVESVLQQTYQSVELIVVDDGSSDSTVEKLAPFPKIKLIQQENQGVAHARNTGLQYANGSLLAFIDQDDRWTADKLTRQVAYLQERPELDMVLAHEEMFLEPGSSRPGWLKPEMLSKPHPSFVPGVWLVRENIFSRVGKFDESFRCGSDTDWLSRAKDLGITLETLAEILLHKRIHAENESQQVEICHKEIAQLLRASINRKRRAS